MHFKEGEIVEFADKGKFHLGAVQNTDEKTGKVKLINAAGRDISLPAKQIQYSLGSRVSMSLPLSNIQNELNSIDFRATEIEKHCDIEELWQLVSGEYETIDMSELISLSFDTPDAAQKLAMIRALRNDRIYFKTLQIGQLSPRPAAIVEDLQRQQQLKAQKDAWRAAFVDEAVKLLKMPPEERQTIIEDGFFQDSSVRDAWQMLEQYAIWGADAEDKVEAEFLLESLQNRINRGFSGTAHFRARHFLRDCGYWLPETHIPMLKYEIAPHFSDELERDALKIYQNPEASSNRTDLTHLNLFSIDDNGTLDIDDAISIEPLENHQVRLGVHIAAPAAAIVPGSALEVEARHRATSIYLPEMRIPMLPLILSENALSLMPGQRRNAISFMLTFDADFNLIDRQIIPSVVESKHRLSYDAVERMLEEGNDSLSDEIRIVQEICEFSAANRRNHGAIDIDLPEYKLDWNPQTQLYEFHPIDTTMMSRQLVSECMILANALAADFCFEHEIPALYRIQPMPVNMPRPETLEALPNDMMRAFAMRRSMMPAASSMAPGLHAGLGLEKYLQATSPLRRYADLLCHYQLESWFANGIPLYDAQTFNALLSESDLGLSHAKSASQEAYQTATLAYLKQLGTAPLQAMILQYNSERGDMAQVVLIDTQWRANVATKTRWPLGTLCTVQVEHINPEEGTLLLRFVDIVN
ncbi:MAG: RNB domain-containing ribonuclease [Proteobacteria bacterium]|nr:RNB domain-containing ribonuclease [Pseudomonadota bacterium]